MSVSSEGFINLGFPGKEVAFFKILSVLRISVELTLNSFIRELDSRGLVVVEEDKRFTELPAVKLCE